MSAGTRTGGLVVTLALVFGALAFLYILFSFKVVGTTEIAVAQRAGSIKGLRQPGIHFDLFMGYTKYDTKVQTHTSTQTAATSDLQDVNVDVTINYRINPANVEDIYKTIGDMDAIKIKVLDPVIAQTLKSIATQYGGEELIQKRTEVSQQIKVELTEKFEEEYDLEVTEVSLTNMTFANAEFNAAIDRKQIAEQDTLRAQYELEKTKIDAEKQAALQDSLTQEILQQKWLEKWNGVLPTSLYINGGDASFLLPAR